VAAAVLLDAATAATAATAAEAPAARGTPATEDRKLLGSMAAIPDVAG